MVQVFTRNPPFNSSDHLKKKSNYSKIQPACRQIQVYASVFFIRVLVRQRKLYYCTITYFTCSGVRFYFHFSTSSLSPSNSILSNPWIFFFFFQCYKVLSYKSWGKSVLDTRASSDTANSLPAVALASSLTCRIDELKQRSLRSSVLTLFRYSGGLIPLHCTAPDTAQLLLYNRSVQFLSASWFCDWATTSPRFPPSLIFLPFLVTT